MTQTEKAKQGAIGFMICTRQRPLMLKNCLLSVIEQIESSDHDDFIIIIENDSENHCENIVAKLCEKFPDIPMHYLLETNIGISFARQTGLNFCLSKEAEWAAFIDDDETLEEGWLEAMRRATLEMDCEVLTGPVRYIYPDEIPVFLKRPVMETIPRGDSLEKAATNNTLLQVAWYSKHQKELQFDPFFRYTGGEDTDFFYALTDLGGKIQWVDDAIVREDVPKERLEMVWQLERRRRVWSTLVIVSKKRNKLFELISRYGLRSLRRFMRGTIYVLLSYPLSIVTPKKAMRMKYKAKRNMMEVLGFWDALFGTQVEPYRNITGS
ncbi:MAG: glycosyltransferase [Hyphomicrobiales bacterium]